MADILIVGDSSVPPREELSYSQTYTYLLKKQFNERSIEVSAVTGNNSRKIYLNLEPFMLYGCKPNIVILNYGIVDVYPRPYPNMIYRLLLCTGLLTRVDNFLKKTKLYYTLGDFFKFKEVKLDSFEKYSEGIVSKLLEKDVDKVIIIGIIKPYKILLKSKDEIVLYNKIFKKLSTRYSEVTYIDIYNDSDEDFTIWDGYHYSQKASNYLVDKIKKIVLDD